MVDVFNRKIMTWEVHETECGELAAQFMQRVVIAEGCATTLHLRADNGAIQNPQRLERRWNGWMLSHRITDHW